MGRSGAGALNFGPRRIVPARALLSFFVHCKSRATEKAIPSHIGRPQAVGQQRRGNSKPSSPPVVAVTGRQAPCRLGGRDVCPSERSCRGHSKFRSHHWPRTSAATGRASSRRPRPPPAYDRGSLAPTGLAAAASSFWFLAGRLHAVQPIQGGPPWLGWLRRGSSERSAAAVSCFNTGRGS